MKLLRDCTRYFALYREHVLQVAIIHFRPERRAVCRIDEAQLNTEPVTKSLDPTLENM